MHELCVRFLRINEEIRVHVGHCADNSLPVVSDLYVLHDPKDDSLAETRLGRDAKQYYVQGNRQ